MEPSNSAIGTPDAGRALLDSEARCNAVLAATGDAVVVCDATGTVVAANPAARRLAAQGAATWHRMPLPAGWELAAPELGPAPQFPTLAVLADGVERRQVRLHATRPNGKRAEFDVTAVPVVDAQGTLCGAATVLVDVTRRGQLESELQGLRADTEAVVAAHTRELVHANEMLERSARFCRAITDAIPAQVAYWERGTVCRFANRAFLDWIGRRTESALGHTRLELYVAADEARLRQRLARALAGTTEAFDIELRSADGRSAAVRMHFVPAAGRDGAVHGVYSVAYDIGGWRQVESAADADETPEDERRRPGGDALAMEATLGELRASLNTVLGLAHVLRRERPAGERTAQLAGLETAGRDALRLVDGLAQRAAMGGLDGPLAQQGD